jgi:eukaryotic-like serine/threonine-protein kinase
MADLSGRKLGPYLLQKKLGQGGMGAVYVGVHQTLQTGRAIKILLPTEVDEAVVERFVREGVISASLRHPNIVEIFDVGEQDEIHFLVMELVEGDSLLQVLRMDGAIPLDRSVTLLRQMADALDYAHARGIVHRDIKPSNVIVGPNDEVTLIDFGIARAMDESRLTRVGVVVGTFEYMAPEVVTEGGGSPGADRYALGIVAYQMLTGRTPFTGESAHSIMYKQVHEPPPPPSRFRPDLSPAAEAALLRQLSKEPDARFPSAQAFVDALVSSTTHRPRQTEATSISDITRPGFDRPTPGSGQTPLPRSGRVTRPVPAATLTPPGAPVLPVAGLNTEQAAATRPTPPPPTAVPPAPLSSSGTLLGVPGTVFGTPPVGPIPPKRSSAGLMVGIVTMLAAVVVLIVAVMLLSPLRSVVTELVGSSPATATAVPPVKPGVTSAPTVAAGPTAGPTAGTTAPPTTAPPTAVPTSPPTLAPTILPTTPPTPAVPPTLAPAERLAQARQSSAAGNHPSALSILDELRKADPALAGLDDTQYDIHMAFARALFDGGNLDGSYQQFEAALAVRPNDPVAQTGRTQIILTKNYALMEATWDRDQDAAIKALEENMQLDPNYRESRPKLYALLIMKADRLIQAGERDAAFPHLMRALEILPGAGEAQQRLVSYTPTPLPTATPRPVVQPQPKPATGGGYSPPPPAPAPAPSGGSSSGGSNCPGGVCP